jgi:hypothetical protein
MKKWIGLAGAVAALTLCLPAGANTIASSTMYFAGTLTDEGGGVYSGVVNMTYSSPFDVYAKEGATAWFGDLQGSPVWTSQSIGSGHDAWPASNPDTPDWYQYSLELSFAGGQYKWALRNHPGSTEDDPWSTAPAGVPMSGTMNWATMLASETDTGAYLPGTGTAEIPGGAAAYGGGAGAWDMDWSWGSEVVPLEYSDFKVSVVWDDKFGVYEVTLTPIPEPLTLLALGSAVMGLAGYVRRRRLA